MLDNDIDADFLHLILEEQRLILRGDNAIKLSEVDDQLLAILLVVASGLIEGVTNFFQQSLSLVRSVTDTGDFNLINVTWLTNQENVVVQRHLVDWQTG